MPPTVAEPIIVYLTDWKNEYQKTFVDIKSEQLATVLREVLKDVKTVNIRSDKLSLDSNLLFNYLPNLDEVRENEKALPEETQNKNKITHLSILIEYLNTDYAPVAKILYPLLKHHEVTYDLLWALFLPNTLVYTICAGSNEPRCLKLDHSQYKQNTQRGNLFRLDCHYVDYNGKTFGEAKAVIEILAFTGNTRIDSLSAFPLAYHHDKEQVREKLIARGRKFLKLRGTHHKLYEGLAFFKNKKDLVRVNVYARIMIDCLTFRKMNPNYPMSLGPAIGSQFAPMKDENSDGDDDSNNDGEPNSIPPKPIPINLRDGDDDSHNDGEPNSIPPKPIPINLRAIASLKPKQMSEDQLLICSPTVLGFSLGDKLYLEFSVEHIRNIVFNPSAFDCLVLPEKQKNLVRALVESYTDKSGKHRPGIDDIIRGKGQGMVVLLHGRPGVGKTLTAEGEWALLVLIPG